MHRGQPESLILDNVPELTSKAMFGWARENSVKLHFIEPGKPAQNAFVESFNERFHFRPDQRWGQVQCQPKTLKRRGPERGEASSSMLVPNKPPVIC